MPVRHRPDFKQALSILRQLKHQEDTAHQQRWKSYSSSWWNWQESWWHSSYEHHHEDGPSTDWSGKPVEKWLGYSFEVWFSELTWCIITVQNSVTASSILLSPTGGVKSVSPIQQNSIKNCYDENNNYNKSDETKCATNCASSQTTSGMWTRTTTCSSPSTTPMTMLTHCTCTSTDAWRTCTETAHASLFHTWWWHRTPLGSSSERIHSHPRSYSWAHLFDSFSPSLLLLFPPVCPRLPLPVPWAPLHDRHGKPALLRCRKEWGHPELLHLSHRYVHHDTSGQNLGPTLKTQCFFLIEICMVNPLAGLWARQFETCLLGKMGESTGFGLPLRALKARSIPIGVRGL